VEIRDLINKSLEGSRQNGEIGKSLEAKVIISETGERYSLLKDNLSILPELFIVSQVEVLEGEPSIKVEPLKSEKCLRCWTIPTELSEVDGDLLCPRCSEVVSKSR